MAQDTQFRLIGTDQAPKDLRAKVTGRSRYAEDFRAEGMAFAKLLLSPVPRGRVVRFDASRALAMEGVYGILTQDDFPDEEGERTVTNTPHYQGEPIAAIAAETETLAAEAIAAIDIEIEPLSFAIDPLDTLRPGGPNPRDDGNVWSGFEVAEVKWSAAEMAALEGDEFPEVEFPGLDSWEIGSVEEGFAQSDVIVARPVVHQSNTHHPMEPRSSMAYWQNGRCFVHCSTQSLARTHRGHARRIGIEEQDMVMISEYVGGGFGSKIPGSLIDNVSMVLSRKINRPVMFRVTRDEETYFGRARPGLQGWVKIGLRASDGRIMAMDLLMIQDSGPYSRPGDYQSAAQTASLGYQPVNMRFRGIPVVTNTPPKGAQRGPGGAQAVTMIQPVIDEAAREAGVDRMDVLYTNAPEGRAMFGPAQTEVTSAFAKEAVQMTRELFNWDERSQRSGQRNGSLVTGIGVAISPYSAGSAGMDGLLIIRPDGQITIHSGVGNLGTGSVFDTAMAAAEALNANWDDVEVVWGDTSRGLAWASIQAGSQTTHAHTRANYAAGLAALRMLQEIAANDLGGAPENYEVDGTRVFRSGNPGVGMTFAQAAQRAIELGGRYSGEELPETLDEMTVRAVNDHLVGQGLVAAATDEFSYDGASRSTVVAAAEVDIDTETGQLYIRELTMVADVGRVLNPRSLRAQASGGVLQGISQAMFEHWAYDLRWGVNQNKRLHTVKPIPVMNIPENFTFAAVDIPDPESPIGSRGIGEPPVGAGGGVIMSAVMDALGVHIGRTPVTPDKILNALEGATTGYTTLQTHV